MKIKAIILARGGSKGIPNKNIMDFCGKPLIQWTIEQCKGSKYIGDCIGMNDNIYVSSDSSKILKVAIDNRVLIVDRPDNISEDTSTSEEAIAHWLELFKIDCDYVVFLQVTSPLRTSEDIDNAIETIINTGADSLYSACKLDDYCIWNNKNESITYDYVYRGRRQDKESFYLENGSIYVFKPYVCFKGGFYSSDYNKLHGNRLSGEITRYIMPFWKSYEIDEPDDIEICEYYMKRKIL